MDLRFTSLGAIALYLLFALNMGQAAETQPYSIGSVPDWVQPIDLLTNTPVPESAQSDGVYFRMVDAQLNLNAKVGQSIFYRVAWEITNANGLDDNSAVELEFHPDYETFTLHFVNIVRGEEVIDRLRAEDISLYQRESELEAKLVDGALTLSLVMPDVRVGDIVEYAYTRTGLQQSLTGHSLGARRLGYSVPLARKFLRLRHPNDHPVHIKVMGDGAAPSKQQSNGFTEYVWSETEQTPVKMDGDIPSYVVALPYVQYSTFANWRGVVDWGTAIYEGKIQIDDAVKAMALSIRNTHPNSVADQVALALHQVQSDIRYFGLEMGDGSLVPRLPSYTIGQRYGDCKDKTVLLVSILRALGIEAHPILVSTTIGKLLPDRLPSPFNFDHVITAVTVGGNTYYLDPTDGNQATGLDYVVQPDFGWGLLLKEGNTKLTNISPNYDGGFIDITERFTPLDEGGYEYVVETLHTGDEADYIRGYTGSRDSAELSEAYRDFTANYYPNVTVLEPVIVNDDRRRNRVVTIEKYRVDPLWEEGDEGNLEADFYPWYVRDVLSKVETSERSFPLSRRADANVTQEISIELGPNWDITPDEASVQDDQFELARSISYDENILRMRYELKTLADQVPAHRVASFRDTVNKGRDLLWYGLQTYGEDSDVESANVDEELPAENEAELSDALWMMLLMLALFSCSVPYLLWMLCYIHRDKARWVGMLGAPRSEPHPKPGAAMGWKTMLVFAVGLSSMIGSGERLYDQFPGLGLYVVLAIAAPFSALIQLAIQAFMLKVGMRLFGHRQPYGNVFNALTWGYAPFLGAALPLIACYVFWPEATLVEEGSDLEGEASPLIFGALMFQTAAFASWSLFNVLGSVGRIYGVRRWLVFAALLVACIALFVVAFLAIFLVGTITGISGT